MLRMLMIAALASGCGVVANAQDGRGGEAPASAGRNPRYALIDSEGVEVPAIIAPVAARYAEWDFDRGFGAWSCVAVQALGERHLMGLQFDLATGRPEPCYRPEHK